MENCLKNETIRVEYIPKYDTIFNVTNSPAKDGMHAEAKHRLPLPYKNGSRVQFLTEKEIEFLETVMNVDLSFRIDPNKKSYWDTFTLPTLTVRPFNLDLSDPVQYIQWRALAWWPKIAATPEDEKARPREVRWRMVNPQIQQSYRSKTGKNKSEAWRIFGQYEKESKEVLLYLYFLLKDKAYDVKQINSDELWSIYEELIEKDAATFIAYSEKNDLKTKALVYAAWMAGILTRKNDGFWYIRNDNEVKLFNEKEDGTIDDAASFLSNPRNQNIKFEIDALFAKYKE